MTKGRSKGKITLRGRLVEAVGEGEEISHTNQFGRQIRKTEGRGQRTNKDTFNLATEFTTNVATKGRMHVVVQTLVEVTIGIEMAPEDQALSVLGPELDVTGQSDIMALMGLTHLAGKLLETRMLGMTGKAVDDVIAFAGQLDKNVEAGVRNEANMLVTERLSQKGTKDSLRGMTSVRRKTREPGTLGMSCAKSV